MTAHSPIDEGFAEEDRKAYNVLGKHMLLGRLDVLLEATGEIAYSHVSEIFKGVPTASSPMASDMLVLSDELIGEIGRVCGVWHLVASECLEAVASAHSDGHILFAPGPLLRSVIEHCSRIGWVLDGPDPRAKAARAWLAQVVANGEDVHTHRNGGIPAPTLAGAPARLDELCEITLPSLFEGEKPDRTARRPSDWTFVGQRWGSHTDAVVQFFENHVHRHWQPATDGRVQYRVASMFAHPSTTAVFAQANQSEPGSATFEWDWSLTRTRTVVALASFEAATASLYSYLGWSTPAATAWAEQLAAFVRDTAKIERGQEVG